MSTRSRTGGRRVTPPGPTFMSEDQLGHYLKDLRNNRPPRPNGSRPLPPRAGGSRLSLQAHRDDTPPRASSALSTSRPSDQQPRLHAFPRANSALSHRRTDSLMSVQSASSGHSPERESGLPGINRALSPTPTFASSASHRGGQYRESGQRWMERQEARSLRNALEEMDIQDDEKRLRAAAQDEATQLVMEHQKYGLPSKTPHAPFRNPDANHVNRLRSHLEEGSHARSQALGGSDRDMPRSDSYRSVSDSSNGSLHGSETRGPSTASRAQSRSLAGMPDTASNLPVKKNGSLMRKQKVNFALPKEGGHETGDYRKGRRSISNDSSKGIFKNPEDYIYEEPEGVDGKNEGETDNSRIPTPVLTVKPRNSLPRGARPQHASNIPSKEKTYQQDTDKPTSTRFQNLGYKSNNFEAPSTANKDGESVSTKNGIEIRGDDIRAATGKRFNDRSSKLATPSAVSERAGRPIVSFDPDWKPAEKETPEQPSIEITAPHTESQSTSSPSIPTISVSDNGPDISVSAPEPQISVTGPSNDKRSARPLPTPAGNNNHKGSGRRSYQDTSIDIQTHPSLRSGLPTATCAACGLAISGRIVTASNSRLHPECFTCHHCSTVLECVAFYEEPAAKREERLATSDNNDEYKKTPRFYCHLDFHELFSPRCKHCKTPIESEVIVACGAEWHEGHFFCAECGDPFTSTTPFVEDSGYAWCVKCHSRRTASKCRGCKLPVLEELVITALGGQWHEKCFACHECRGDFGPEGRFFVREGQPRYTAKGRQIGGPVQHAVCEGCESRRLRA